VVLLLLEYITSTKTSSFYIGIRDQYRKYRTRNYAKDLDQIHEELKKLDEKEAVMSQELDHDLPGGGQFHCVECA